MVALIFGVWDGVFYDNRHTYEPSAPADLPLEQFSQFNPGNPIMSFVGDRGFLVMDRRANLAFSLWRYYDRTMHESCGKCTPCRIGTRVIAEALEKACQGQFTVLGAQVHGATAIHLCNRLGSQMVISNNTVSILCACHGIGIKFRI